MGPVSASWELAGGAGAPPRILPEFCLKVVRIKIHMFPRMFWIIHCPKGILFRVVQVTERCRIAPASRPHGPPRVTLTALAQGSHSAMLSYFKRSLIYKMLRR